MFQIIGIIIFVSITFPIVSNIKTKRHFNAIKPDDMINYRKIRLSGQDTLRLIGDDPEHPVHFIAKDRDKRISFPESAHPKDRYYIIHMTCSPWISQSIHSKGCSGSISTSTDPISAAIDASRQDKDKMDTAEHIVNCYVTLVDAQLKDIHNITIRCKKVDYDELSSSYKLDDLELKHLKGRLEGSNSDSNQSTTQYQAVL